MGKQTDGIELQIEERRLQIEGRVGAFRERRDADVRGVVGGAKARVSGVVTDVKEIVGLDDRMREHPYSLLAAGVGLGAIVGFVTGGGNDARWKDEYRILVPAPPGRLAGTRGSVAGRATHKVTQWILSEIQGLVVAIVQNLVMDFVSGRLARARDANSRPAPTVIEV